LVLVGTAAQEGDNCHGAKDLESFFHCTIVNNEDAKIQIF
jgi:hypothetical protein